MGLGWVWGGDGRGRPLYGNLVTDVDVRRTGIWGRTWTSVVREFGDGRGRPSYGNLGTDVDVRPTGIGGRAIWVLRYPNHGLSVILGGSAPIGAEQFVVVEFGRKHGRDGEGVGHLYG